MRNTTSWTTPRKPLGWLSLLLVATISTVLAGDGLPPPPGKLIGIGYREQELQTAKGSKFSSEEATGVLEASFGGGTSIFIKGTGLDINPQSNLVDLRSLEHDAVIPAPPLTEDDSFGSHPQLGTLAYKLPSLADLFRKPEQAFDKYDTLTFFLEIRIKGVKNLMCADVKNCMIRYVRSYTPILYKMSPRVLYQGAWAETWFDPKSVMSMIKDLDTDEKPFINTKIDESLLDYTDTVDSRHKIHSWAENRVKGLVGDLPNGNHKLRMTWETGYAKVLNETAMHCTYDQKDCYYIKTVPVINSMSQHKSYLKGQQFLTVKGHGFGTGKIEAKVDGVSCAIHNFTHTEFTCKVNEKSLTSTVNTPQVGTHGINHYIYNSAQFLKEELLITRVETETLVFHDKKEAIYAKFKSWFVPPVTSHYRFRMSCDNRCEFRLGTNSMTIEDPELLIDINSQANWHDYFRHKNSNGEYVQFSKWIQLEKGKFYYMAYDHIEGSSAYHMNLGVEIMKEGGSPTEADARPVDQRFSNNQGTRRLQASDAEKEAQNEAKTETQTSTHIDKLHHQPRYEVQQISLQAETRFERTFIQVTQLDGADYKLIFQKCGTCDRWVSDFIKPRASASDFKNAIKEYFSKSWGSDIFVYLAMFDADNVNVNATSSLHSTALVYEYEIVLRKMIEGQSSQSVMAVGNSIKVTLPVSQELYTSLKPYGGNMRVKCVDRFGKVQYSGTFPVTANANFVRSKIMQGCDHFTDRVQVKDTGRHVYRQNGREFILSFKGYDGDPGQFELELTDDNFHFGMGGQTKEITTLVPYAHDYILYEPIPFEMLRTFVEKPQLEVQVDGQNAVCRKVDCDFVYEANVGEIQSFTYTPATNKVEITGVKLPAKLADVQKIEFAKTECRIDKRTTPGTGEGDAKTHFISETSITCTLESPPVCGMFQPILTTQWGEVSSSASKEKVSCAFSAVEPAKQLNLLGRDSLTFKGTNLPRSLEDNDISIVFSDSQSRMTSCTIVSAKDGEISCKTKAFPASSEDQAVTLIAQINGVQATHSLQFRTRPSVDELKAMEPTSASPVLKTKIKFTLGLTIELKKEDFKVTAISKTDAAYIRYLNVVAVDNTAKTITCLFGGAKSGDFDLEIIHKDIGLIGAGSHDLKVFAEVTSLSVNTISPYGGNVITIKGKNFGKEITDNPVQISYNGGVASTDCFVSATSETEITCRVDTGIDKSQVESATLIVFLKTSEEAKCDPAVCKITFTPVANLPTITGTTFTLNVNHRYELTLSGTNFGTDKENTFMRLEKKVKQNTLSVTDTKVKFEIIDASYFNLTGKIDVIFPSGVPAGNEKLKEIFDMEPLLIELSPTSGSIAGSELFVTVEGVYKNTDEKFKLMAGSVEVCESLELISYAKFKCKTKPNLEIPLGTKVIMKGRKDYSCKNLDATKCEYGQKAGGAFPVVTEVAKSSTEPKIVFTGTNFDFDDAFKPKVSLGGALASSTEINAGAGTLTAKWDLGVPVVSEAEAPLIIYEDADGRRHKAVSDIKVENAVAISSSSSSLSCSFAGGCLYEVSAPGLSTVLKKNPKENYLSICDSVCEASEITADKYTCKVPELSTVASNANFGIKQETHNLKSGRYFGSGENATMVFDDDIVKEYKSTSSECHVGMEFKKGHVGVLSQVKFFMGDIDDKMLYAGFLKFQASNDKSSWTTIFTADMNIHEGWNKREWETESEQPKFRYYRFFSTQSFGCNMREIKFRGVEAIQDNNNDYTCQAKLFLGGKENSASLNSVLYEHAKTAHLTKVEPRYGSVEANTPIVFTGKNFPTDHSKISVVIDGKVCDVTASTSTTISCTTAKRPGLVESSMEIKIDGYGLVSNNGVIFKYVSFWTADNTWGGEFAPMDEESVWIPKGLNLLVDVKQSPKLKAVVVEGGLIFYPDTDPNHERTFDAQYIFVNGGTMEVGTEEFPYTSKLTITMHSKISDPYLPIYGNKVIGLRAGTLDLHGVKRNPTWTSLESTADAGATEVTLRGEVDWKVGEEVGIASSNYEGREAEKRTITKVAKDDSNNFVLTLDKPLKYKHLAYTEVPDPTGHPNDKIDLRAEIGLLTRNVKYRGNPEDSEKDQYGANMFLHSEGDESLVARIENIELFQVGQAFKIGRYAIHFHMIGTVHKSYVKGISVHQSFNRMTTLHAVEYLTIDNNVGFDIMGHAIFMEDGVERKNYISNNLIMMVKRSFSLLNTDQTPACFWFTNPDNNIVGNHAAGSDRYGYWYDLQIHAIGPSANTDICPENERAGENRNNHAHSVGRYGLRIFHNMISREKPCEPIPDYDPLRPDDPYHKNRPYTNDFRNFTGWKNGRNCAIAKDVSDIRFHDFKCADNLFAGAEVSVTKHFALGEPQIRGGVFIGKSSQNDEALIKDANPKGIITARSENFGVTGAHFYSYDWNKAAAFGTCSHCEILFTRDDGGRQHNVSALYFHETVKKKVLYTVPFKAIFYDLDGTFTGLGPKTWATHDYKHLTVQKECTLKKEMYDGVVCDSTQRLRRITFFKQVPKSIFFEESIFVLPYDDEIIKDKTPAQLEAYKKEVANYGEVKYDLEGDPGLSTVPVVLTGHKYKFHWSDAGVDFEEMKLWVSQNWEHDDDPIYIVHNFTDQREVMEMKVKVPDVDKTANKVTINEVKYSSMSIPDNWMRDGLTGQHNFYPEKRELHFIISGKNKKHRMDLQETKFIGMRCDGPCQDPVDEEQEVEDKERLWSLASSWEGGHGKVPVAGDKVEIKSGWNMIYDLEDSPVLESLVINGKLSFKDDKAQKLRSKVIFVRAGELQVGTKENPINHKAEIILSGDRNDKTLAFDNNLFGSNKVLANIGKVSMFGESRGGYMTRLRKTVYKGDKSLLVEPWLDIRPGDELGLASQTFTMEKSSDVKVKSYNKKTGAVELQTPVEFYHWGQARSTESKYGFDIRCEVILLTRNVRVIGSPGNIQGGHIITADIVEMDASNNLVDRQGQLILDNVELYNCSQVDSVNAAIRFENARGKESSVTNCAIHHGLGWGVKVLNSKGVTLKGNSIFYFTRIGIAFDGIENVKFDDNIVARVLERVAEEPRGGVLGCTMMSTIERKGLSVTNNIVAGAPFGGFTTRGHRCGEENKQQLFRNNTVHSIKGTGGGYGIEIEVDKKDPIQRTCFAGSHFNSYKCTHQGMASYQRSRKIEINGIRTLDNKEGFTAALFTQKDEYKKYEIEISNSFFYGESDIEDCPLSPKGEKQGFCYKFEKLALVNAQITENGKPTHALVCDLPFYKQWSANSWNLKTTYRNNVFAHFTPKTRQGKKQAGIGFNDETWDVIFIHEFENTKFIDVEEGALAYLRAPPKSWAVIEICGNFPCTGPWNAIFNFKNSKFEGKRPALSKHGKKEFKIISNNPGISPYLPNCEKNDIMNAYVCTEDKLGLLMFESLDSDRLSRSMQPIYVKKQGSEINNKLNAFKDHNWDGFYNKQERLQRFPAMVYAPKGSVYDITYTGAPPQNQTYKLMALHKGLGMTVRIAYPSAESRQIKIGDRNVAMNQWNEGLKNYGPIKQRFCGENRYIGVKNILEFYLNTGCEIKILPRNAIQTKVRMEWSMEKFFAAGGTTKFIDRLAGSLGIHASTIKVVSVYEGSLVVNYEIEAENTDTLKQIEETQTKKFATGKVNLGAPVLDVAAGSISIIQDGIVTAPGFKPVVITATETNKEYNVGDIFKPVDVQQTTETQQQTNVVQEEVIVNSTSTETQIVYTNSDNTVSTVIVTVAITCLFFILGVGLYKYYAFQKQKDLIDAQIIHEKHLQYENSRRGLGMRVTAGGHVEIPQSSPQPTKPKEQVHLQFDPRFDPNADFGVFGMSDSSGSKIKPQDQIVESTTPGTHGGGNSPALTCQNLVVQSKEKSSLSSGEDSQPEQPEQLDQSEQSLKIRMPEDKELASSSSSLE